MNSKLDLELSQPLFSGGVHSMRICVCFISQSINYSQRKGHMLHHRTSQSIQVSERSYSDSFGCVTLVWISISKRSVFMDVLKHKG